MPCRRLVPFFLLSEFLTHKFFKIWSNHANELTGEKLDVLIIYDVSVKAWMGAGYLESEPK